MRLSRYRLTVGLLVVNLIAGLFVFRWGLGLAWVDSFYFVVTIVTTIGFGDFNLSQAPVWIKVYGMGLMLSGAGGYALVVALIADRFVRLRLLELVGRRRVKMVGHIVVGGYGKVGSKILENLVALGDRVAVIDRSDSDEMESLRARGVPFVIGDVRRPETLLRAGVESCRALILCTDDDLANLEGALAARELQPGLHVVLRMYDQTLARRIEKGFNLPVVLSTSTLAAPTFALAAHDPGIIASAALDGDIQLTVEFNVTTGLRGVATLEELRQRVSLAVLRLTRENGTVLSYPAGHEVLSPGDRLVLVLDPTSLRQLRDLA